MDLITFFRGIAPTWESSIIWDNEDRNYLKIERRRDKLENLAIESGLFDDTPWTDIADEALDYIVK